MNWTKIAKKEESKKVIWSPDFTLDEYEDIIAWIEKNWVEGYKMGTQIPGEDSAKYVLVPEGQDANPEWNLEEVEGKGALDSFSEKAQTIKNLKENFGVEE